MPVFCNNCGSKNRDTSKFCSNCSGSLQQIFSSTGPLPPGTILENRYKIITLLKSGGMGAVYKAVDSKFDTICAVKELLPPYGASRQVLAKSEKWFKREAKLLNTLHHTNLPKVSDYFLAFSRYYLVMTFIDGKDLETILQKNGKSGLPEDKVIGLAKQILTVLKYLHNQKPPIVYRDIKPANIMLHKDGRAMLIDFGIARAISEVNQTKKTAIGTQGYAPHEQCRGHALPQSDIYALGATMHHLLTGIEPIGFLFEPLRKLKPSLSSKIEDIVMKAISYKVEDRFQSAKDMADAFNNKQSSVLYQTPSVPLVVNQQINIPPPTAPITSIKQPSSYSHIDCTGWTLHKAAENGKLEIVKALLSRGADVNAETVKDWTPLHWASAKGHKGVAEFLISRGANINAEDNEGWTPLHWASYNGHKGVAEFLISRGANINAKNNYSRTPLYLAYLRDHKDVAEFLISKGAKQQINSSPIIDCTGWTLHKAVENGNLKIVKALLSRGADVNAKDNKGKTPLERAIEKDHKDVANFLISQGAKKGSCFITTATCLSLQKFDNCYELKTFRKFRDSWLSHQPDGDKLITEYYSVAPDIVESINKMPEKDEIYKSIWTDYLSKCLLLIECSRYEEAKELYITMVDTLMLIILDNKV